MTARPGYTQALQATGLLDLLRAYDPHVAGTPPLGVDLPASDIDILCHAPDALAFTRTIWQALVGAPAFSIHQWTGGGRPVIATFTAQGWCFEIFASIQPVAEQAGWRHFLVERRLLALGGEALRSSVVQHRQAGLKTEPAFAAALGLKGDPYRDLLELHRQTDGDLVAILAAAGYLAHSEQN
ncbi:DUF4269 domain-containing protein [Labrys okinawensis]|uniref:DUF4269 domain-containing protein n=1 Tax=Labrys okinawensis TaxID=346911 RepID=A0A2S9QCV6_9HYPH|nr:DUF4269 domain-containing protein [Labrys okinawensis]PRH87150.1 DUF4269 domain-containing protein [Labrys okinawensis]